MLGSAWERASASETSPPRSASGMAFSAARRITPFPLASPAIESADEAVKPPRYSAAYVRANLAVANICVSLPRTGIDIFRLS